MTTTRRTLSSLAVLALAAGLMTGCGDKDDPSPSAGSEATASAPVEQSDGGGESAKPDVPKPDPKDYAGMDEHTDEGAEQAYKYFWAVMLWSYQTGDTEVLKSLFGESCASCDQNLHEIEKLNKTGKWWSRATIDDRDLRTYESEKHELEVGYTFILSEHSEPVYGNSRLKQEPDTRYGTVGGMSWSEGSWVVNAFNLKTEKVVDG
ncbi:DUF6318 family protein [Brachybacterium halotolerans subsp. kimchii]|uniref:DUF6318 family protein n=1 Tax=Brachybacterium kimchii TaxID=2942909 RepID=A0ABY4N487_9MICO|nr:MULTISPECIES: DUF6318 family protein [Brachybacterium]MCG7310584.1 DUF6318 family protein [Brachybacterium sp. ACRRE]UEJ81568.1 DUF6318 family protein [Brachybacterium halotolerans subsp. kimchii]UQN28936.1 DUF6318 family protein [Brachybacterium kimchii]